MINKSKNQLMINMIAQIISFAVGIGISFFLTPFVVENVGAEAYGFVGLANSFISYATIVTSALNSMAGRFITISIHKGEIQNTNKYFTSVFISNLVLAIPLTILATFVLIFLNKLVEVPRIILADVTILWAFLFGNFIISLIGNVFSVATFAQNRLDLSSVRSIISNILRVIILVGMYLFFRPYVWYIGFAAFICGIYLIIENYRLTKKLLPLIKINRKYFDWSKIKELILSGIWRSITSISNILSTGLDLLITNIFVGAAAMGTVSISKVLPSYILSLFGMLAGVFSPQLTISYAKNDMEDVKNQIISSIRLLSFFSSIPISFLLVYGNSFFTLWIPTQDADLLNLLSVLGCLAFPLVLSLEPLWNIFTITNKVKQSSIFLIINSFGTIGIVFILLQFAVDDIAKMCIVVGVSSAVGIIRGLTFLPLYGAKCLNLKLTTFYPIIFKNVWCIFITIFFTVIIKKFINGETWVTLIFATILLCMCSCIVNYFMILTQSERKKLKELILRRKNR